MGRSGSFLSKNGWEWVVFLEKWVGVGESNWEWLGVGESGCERNSVKPVIFDIPLLNNLFTYFLNLFISLTELKTFLY